MRKLWRWASSFVRQVYTRIFGFRVRPWVLEACRRLFPGQLGAASPSTSRDTRVSDLSLRHLPGDSMLLLETRQAPTVLGAKDLVGAQIAALWDQQAPIVATAHQSTIVRIDRSEAHNTLVAGNSADLSSRMRYWDNDASSNSSPKSGQDNGRPTQKIDPKALDAYFASQSVLNDDALHLGLFENTLNANPGNKAAKSAAANLDKSDNNNGGGSGGFSGSSKQTEETGPVSSKISANLQLGPGQDQYQNSLIQQPAQLSNQQAANHAPQVAAATRNSRNVQAASDQTQLQNAKVTIQADNSATVYGQAVTFTATVSAEGNEGGTPTGQVFFLDGKNAIGEATLTNGQATFTTQALGTGTHHLRALYQGDSSFQAAESGTIKQTVDQAATQMTLTQGPDPSIVGKPVTYTAIVGPVAPGAGVPTGKVNFYSDGNPLGNADLQVVNGMVQASLTTTAQTPGMSVVSAEYLGDNNFEGCSSSIQDPSLISTTTTISPANNPGTYGTGDALTATVSASSGASGITGTVYFYDGTTMLGTASVAGPRTGATATLNAVLFSAGTHSLSAYYSGDNNYANSTSSSANLTVNKYSQIIGTFNASTTSPVVGQPVTFTASVPNPNTALPGPTGTMTFKDGTTTIGTGTVQLVYVSGLPTYEGTLTTSWSSANGMTPPHSITAVYSGDSNHTSVTSSAISLSVAKSNTSTSLTSSVNPSALNQPVTFTAKVTASGSGSGTPTGTVTFKAGGTTLGTSSLSNGVATYTTSTLTQGTHSMEADYNGDSNFNTSSNTSLTQTINAATNWVLNGGIATPDPQQGANVSAGPASVGLNDGSLQVSVPVDAYQSSGMCLD